MSNGLTAGKSLCGSDVWPLSRPAQYAREATKWAGLNGSSRRFPRARSAGNALSHPPSTGPLACCSSSGKSVIRLLVYDTKPGSTYAKRGILATRLEGFIEARDSSYCTKYMRGSNQERHSLLDAALQHYCVGLYRHLTTVRSGL